MFISIEGIDGAGKDTLVKSLREWFEEIDVELVYFREPGGTPIAEEIRHVLLDRREETVYPETEIMLLNACRAQNVKTIVRNPDNAGKVIMANRFVHSTFAYQSAKGGVDIALMKLIHDGITENCYPDVVLYLDISAEESRRRLAIRYESSEGVTIDRIESKEISFFEEARNVYLSFRNDRNFYLIDGMSSREDILEQAKRILLENMHKCNIGSSYQRR